VPNGTKPQPRQTKTGMRYDTALATGTTIVDGHGAVNGFTWGFALQILTYSSHKRGPNISGVGGALVGGGGPPAIFRHSMSIVSCLVHLCHRVYCGLVVPPRSRQDQRAVAMCML
jgi:hypothetical protein